MPIPTKPENLQRLSAKNIIYQALCDWIISGEMLPGEKLMDMELARHFSVSRTPVREALQMLETQKLVHVIPGKATVVADVDAADIEKCYRPLAAIQALAAELACQRLTDADLDALEADNRRFASACDKDRAKEAIESDASFHERILEAADNEYITEFSHMMILHIQRIKYHFFHCDRLRKQSVEQHSGILQALRNRDGQLAASLMRAHWLHVMERCLQDVIADGRLPETTKVPTALTE